MRINNSTHKEKPKDIIKYGDIGTPERHLRKELVTTIVDGTPKTMVKHQSPVVTYYNKNQIDSTQLAAAQKLYQSYVIGWVGYQSYEQREKVDGGNKILEQSEKQIKCADDFKNGINAVTDENRQLIIDIVITEKYVSDIFKHWYVRKKAKQILREELDNVAKIFNFK